MTTNSIKQIMATASITEPTVNKRGKKRNVRAGHGYERDCRDEYRRIGYKHVVTSRSESKSRDDQKIDLMNEDEHLNGRFPYNVQCKNSCEIINYGNIYRGHTKITKSKKTGELKTIDVPPMTIVPGVINVIMHKHTRLIKREITTGEKKGQLEEIFEKLGEYAILTKKDFLSMVTELKRLKELEYDLTH